ncbi:MAG: amidohydrolase family protein [Streptosporangiaceae bacterium]|nr:amidohydrolase family protein [Streptosporangiaceae bacterium]
MTVTDIRGRIPDSGFDDGIVTVEAGVITYVGSTAEWERMAGGAAPPPAGTILPGLVDIHCHGGGGHSFATTDPEEALAAARHHALAGTTGVVASIVTAAPRDMLAQVRSLAPLAAEGHILGIHLEGPFLSGKRRGAQALEFLLDPDPALTEDLLAAGDGAVRVMTVAPELPGAGDVIRVLRDAGVVVALGHTDADYELMRGALAGLGDGALVTHLANGMPPIHHRSGGPVAAALVAASAGEASVELIADGVHVDQGFTRLVFAAAAPGRVVLVTDAMAAAGMPDGCYELGPQQVRVASGVARLEPGDEGGPPALAGGTSRLLEVVARCAGQAGVPETAAIQAASAVPARVLGAGTGSGGAAPRARGAIAPGMTADLVVTGGEQPRVMRNGRWLSPLSGMTAYARGVPVPARLHG